MIGVYDYTVVLTYLSLASAMSGIFISLSGNGHPYLGTFCLLMCGLFDAFDGKVARTKANRTENEVKFGIQIDSLSDVIAFGVLPACIGVSVLRNSALLKSWIFDNSHWLGGVLEVVLYVIVIVYALAALIRLAYFNVTEEERQKTEGGVRKVYTGMPVTTAALIVPSVLVLYYLFDKLWAIDLSLLLFAVLLISAYLFLCKWQFPKAGLRGILLMVGIGLVEFLALIISLIVLN